MMVVGQLQFNQLQKRSLKKSQASTGFELLLHHRQPFMETVVKKSLV